LPDGPGRFPRDFTCPAVLRNLSTEPGCCRLQDCHLLWSLVPESSTSNPVCDSAALRPDRPYNPREQALWFGLVRVRSPLLAESLTCFLFLQVLRWFTSLRCPPRSYGFRAGSSGINRSGFPHSEIPGSKPACGSPGLIAACHVLHRLLAPRHSPYALSSLTKCHLHTACVWSKNYRLRGIQLSTNPPSLPPAASARQARDQVTMPVSYSIRSRREAHWRRDACVPAAGKPCAASAAPKMGRLRPILRKNGVENTGLEPVTSWLQTRRSPS